jgi:hypothetical protein
MQSYEEEIEKEEKELEELAEKYPGSTFAELKHSKENRYLEELVNEELRVGHCK